MKEPSKRFLKALAEALREAEHGDVAQSMAAGLLWSMYPEWFDKQQWAQRCTNCGEWGKHFVPPSLGDAGFFACKSSNLEREKQKQ